MKVFLFWPDDNEEYIESIKDFEKKGNKILYWVYSCTDGNHVKSAFPETIFHDHYDAIEAIPPSDDLFFDPPSKDLIDKFKKTESIVLTMMNKHFDNVSLDDRRHIYYKILGYWFGILKKYSPDLIIFYVVPHSVYNYVVYELANFLKIKTILFDSSQFNDRSLLMNDFRVGSEKLKEIIVKNETKHFSLKDLAPDIREYYELNTNKDRDPTPLYFKEEINKFSSFNFARLKFKIIWGAIKDGSIFSKIPPFLYKYYGNNIIKEYRSVQTIPDLDKPYVYMALNYQPECTTSPQGDVFVDLILAIEILSAALPEGWCIYVKEHPGEWFPRGINYSTSRYPGYYERIAKIKNVSIIPVETNSYELIYKAKAVSTVTGTAAWEALFRNKPSIIFGHPWYQDCPLLFRVDSVDSCKEAFNKIIGGYSVSSDKLINYLKSFEEASVECYLSSFAEKNSKIGAKKSAGNAMSAILENISENFNK
jgi:hypothetical protein